MNKAPADTSGISERVAAAILFLRNQRVILDSELAKLYEVEVRTLVQAVKRNLDRFPADFMFQISNQEVMRLRSQTVISNSRGGRRRMLASNEVLARRLSGLEAKYDQQFRVVFEAIRELMAAPEIAPRRPIGFVPTE